jgi:hypothetical protein
MALMSRHASTCVSFVLPHASTGFLLSTILWWGTAGEMGAKNDIQSLEQQHQ